jgi:hypothetical protein
MESVSELAHEYCYRRKTQPDWSAVRVCWYRPTAEVMPEWRRDVLDLCDLMETKRPLLVATVREALATRSDAELLELGHEPRSGNDAGVGIRRRRPK